MPMDTVSLSRISPTIITSGSARRKARMMVGKSSPAFLLICTWRSPFWVISTGSSTVQILVSGLLMYLRMECSVVVLPEPVGPHTKNKPYGCLLYTSDAADDLLCVDLGGRRIIK